MDGFAFIALHGSENRDVPVGYSVIYIAMDENGDPVGEPVKLLAHVPPNAQWDDGFRPVDVEFDDCGRLLVSSDGTLTSGTYRGSKIVRIESHPVTTIFTAPPTVAPLFRPSSLPTEEPAPPSSAASVWTTLVPVLLLIQAFVVCMN
jgi:hypothetical protein